MKGPRSLGGVEVEKLIAAFSASDISEGLISYRDFCRFIDPPRDVVRTMDKLRTYSQKMSEKENLKCRDIFRVLFDLKVTNETINEQSFIQKMLKTQVDCLPIDISNLFKFADMDDDGLISLDQFVAVLNLDDIAGVPALLQDKLRIRVNDLHTRKISVLKMFQEVGTLSQKISKVIYLIFCLYVFMLYMYVYMYIYIHTLFLCLIIHSLVVIIIQLNTIINPLGGSVGPGFSCHPDGI
jgi:Ca2+-binding EF-hand superfamily protein